VWPISSCGLQGRTCACRTPFSSDSFIISLVEARQEGYLRQPLAVDYNVLLEIYSGRGGSDAGSQC